MKLPNALIGPTEFFITERYDAHVMAWSWYNYMMQFKGCNTGLMAEVDRMIAGMKR